MENFSYDWKNYSDLDELIDSILDYSEEVSDLPEDWEIECMGSKFKNGTLFIILILIRYSIIATYYLYYLQKNHSYIPFLYRHHLTMQKL